MSARTRGSTAVAVALTATLTAATAALLTGCGPTSGARAVSTPPAATGAPGGGGSTAPAGGAAPSATTAPSTSAATTPAGGSTPAGTATTAGSTRAPVLNGTAHSGLTISDGTRYVVMNGTRVDFGTAVRDLAWSPDGRKAAFIDGAGNLAVADPNGTGRVTVARNPGGQNWSHPTWQVTGYDTIPELSRRNNIFFAVRRNGVSELDSVPANAVSGTPKKLGLGGEPGDGAQRIPQTGNSWPSAGGTHGSAVYANSGGEVFIRDDYVRQQGSVLTHGSQPAMSHTDGEEIVFVRSAGGHDHLFLETPTDAGPVFRDLTPHATTDYTEPAWSPDGSTIAARTPAGIVTLSTKSSATPELVSTYTGLPSYRG
ncbi:hypothetical protein [Streptomyces sp. RKAG293]|uniref:hypothetical protein n=1 Tax=Streptomyces sp. RKAG293 TaxID=2893403 RepID=UPI0020336396|nr:hypothetical protein [Streptomyces sp. RKAG293]MCM2420563.1 hypothetical protein [Streptomyces sp. RKAG293]